MFKNLLLIPFAYSNLTLIALLLLTVTSCSVKNSPVIYYNSFDFSQVNSYSFYQSGSEFFDSQNLSYAQRSRIELAIEKHLDSQSFHYSDLNSADIIVTYHIVEQSTASYKAGWRAKERERKQRAPGCASPTRPRLSPNATPSHQAQSRTQQASQPHPPASPARMGEGV